MIELTDAERRRAFSAWLRTGRLSTVRIAEGVELKFNPWHDPDDGRFTFAGNGRYYGPNGEGDGSGDWPGVRSHRSYLCYLASGEEMMSSLVSEPKPYIPASLSEIYDQLGSMVLYAPTFIDPLGDFPNRNIDSEFLTLTEGFGTVRTKLGEDRYAQLMDLAARAKALFAADQDDTNGKTDEGRALLFEMEDVLKDLRNRRVQAKLPDGDGEITGD